MDSRRSLSRYNASIIEDRLERAGRTLLALPHAGCFPAGFLSTSIEMEGVERRRYPLPTPRQISEMDEAYRWPALVADVETRRLVLMRSLVIPDGDPDRPPRYLYSWRRLREMTGLHRDTLMLRWGRGIDMIVTRLNQPGLCTASGGPVGPSSRISARWVERAMKAATLIKA